MGYTEEQFEVAIKIAARRCGLLSHTTELEKKRDLFTWADKILSIFFRKGMHIKRSYANCDSLDITFFFLPSGRALYTYAGYADERDSGERLVAAMQKAEEMRVEMERALKEITENQTFGTEEVFNDAG